jgi:Glucose-6-phosphate dehydrogenase subunit
MSAVFNALPGLDVDVGSISGGLDRMWDDTAAKGGAAPTDFKATQLNLVLHLGFGTTVEDALVQFQNALRFAQRYPCRVVMLCPLHSEDNATEMRAKIYGECFLGKSKDDTRCVEFVALSYPQMARPFLESQVSICLSADLPLYYWVNRFTVMSHLTDYQYFLRESQRVLIDSATAPPDALTYPWPRPEAVRDLVGARLLHVRQNIGQFLSAYDPAVLVKGLRAVTVAATPSFAAEGRVLLAWTRERMAKCGAAPAVDYAGASLPAGTPGSIELRFDYGDTRQFRWHGDFAKNASLFEADFGAGRVKLPATASLLAPENVLADAIFF